MAIDGSAIKEIRTLADDANGKPVTIDGEKFYTRPLYRAPLPERQREDHVDAIEVATLQAIVDYLEVQQDGIDPATHFIHIVGPREVHVVGNLIGQGGTNQRHTYLRAQTSGDKFPWGVPQDTEDMIIGVQARFAETEDRERLFRVVGNLASEEKVKVQDDGVTQRATARTGVRHLENVTVSNPFHLAPFRTFAEIDPPVSPFILRLRQAATGNITAGLWEADGGAWKLEAVQRIREWLDLEGTGYKVVG